MLIESSAKSEQNLEVKHKKSRTVPCFEIAHLKFFKLAKYGFHFYYANDIVHLEDVGFLYCNYDLCLIWKYNTISKIQLCLSCLISPRIEKLHF